MAEGIGCFMTTAGALRAGVDDGAGDGVEALGEVGGMGHVRSDLRVGAHGREGLEVAPLRVVDDTSAFGAAMDVRGHEAVEVAHRLFGGIDRVCTSESQLAGSTVKTLIRVMTSWFVSIVFMGFLLGWDGVASG